jgi:MinD superfamily P-loop ATPase
MPVIETTKAQATAIPHVVDDLCLACRKCLARTVCRSKAILQIDPGEPPFIDPSRCYGCRACIPACPQGAIVLDASQPPSSLS